MIALRDLEAIAGPPTVRTECTAIFPTHPSITIRHSRGRIESMFDRSANRAGGLDAIARTFGLPLATDEVGDGIERTAKRIR